MSYDYQQKEEELQKYNRVHKQILDNMNKYKLEDPNPSSKPDFSDTVTAENKNRDD
jgi:hypothetical protein